MAIFDSVKDFQKKVDVVNIKSRADFLYYVKWAKFRDCWPYPDNDQMRAMLFAMNAGLLPREHVCDVCGQPFKLSFRSDTETWEWSQESRGCDSCFRKRQSLTRGTVLKNIRAKNWLHFFDSLCMWTFDYPAKIIQQETGVHHKQLLEWEKTWHLAVDHDLSTRLKSFELAATAPKSANTMRNIKRPSASFAGRQKKVHQQSLKRPSSTAQSPAKRPSSQRKPNLKRPSATKFKAKKQAKTPEAAKFYSKFKYVIEADESHLNKSKPGSLTRTARVQNDQVWVWGATIPKMPERFLFRILVHADDACKGHPRGKVEILQCLRVLDIPRKTILVTDGWKATLAAVKELRAEKGWTKHDLWHEVVNHSAGEIVNANGFTTNHIENRWSVVKRWVRKRMGGRMPNHSNRLKWRALLNEFQWRKIVSKGHSLDWGHTWYVPLFETLQAIRQYSLE